MASKANSKGGKGLSRRDFLKASAAGAAGLAAMDWAIAEPALAVQGMTEGVDYDTYHTTCPYCSASCGQVVAVSKGTQGHTLGEVLDLYGDADSPLNNGGLCAKGSGAYQLVTNPRRVGAFTGTHPVNSVFAADTTTYPDGVAYMRTGNGAWSAVALDTALSDIATRLTTARGPLSATNYNTKNVAFLGCSHMNNEQNYLYRKLIANFGSSNTEHQARI